MWYSSTGYAHVTLNKKGIKKTFSIHKLVGTMFIENPNNYPVINHRDENKKNNVATNLEWCEYSYNTRYGTGIERSIKDKCKKVVQYDLKGNYIETYKSMAEASKKTKIYKTGICRCCKNIRQSAGGYIWRYLEEAD